MTRRSGPDDFWRDTPLEEMTDAQWESLCDGCGRCCLLKLEDEDDGAVSYTDVHCRLFDPDTCRCGNYAIRKQLVPGCVVLTPQTIREIKDWMPATCAYRLLAPAARLAPAGDRRPGKRRARGHRHARHDRAGIRRR